MDSEASLIIDALGGTSAVATLIEAPVSTVHSWRTNGIPRSRMAHIRLAAKFSGHDAALEKAFATIAARPAKAA